MMTQTLNIPHIGQEVIVEFLEGDPDRPLITGRVYNADNMPPIPLPENKHKSIIQDDYGNEIVFDGTSGDEHIRLYSPHHDSGLELGRSWVDFTKSDKAMLTLGNSFTAGIGTKTDFYAGSAVIAKLGLSSSLTLGLMTNLKWGDEYNWSYTSTNTTNKGPITQFTEEDILSLSKQDQVIAAGDQLCLVGGADKEKSEQKKARSIVNIYPDSITLSVGSPTVAHKKNHPNEIWEGQLYEKYVSKPTQWRGLSMMAFMTAAVNAIIPVVFQTLRKSNVASDQINAASNILAIIEAIAIPATIKGKNVIGTIKTKRLQKDKKIEGEHIEPVEHVKPAAKIELDKDGRVLLSTGEPNLIRSFISLNEGTKIQKDIKKSEDKKGTVIVFAETDINLDALENIILTAKGDIRLETPKGKAVNIKSDKTKINGEISHRYWRVLGK